MMDGKLRKRGKMQIKCKKQSVHMRMLHILINGIDIKNRDEKENVRN